MVDIRFVRKFERPLSLDRLRRESKLKAMHLLRKGSRLSVQPVSKLEWDQVMTLAALQPE
jgi:predicted RNA-binding protein with PUA-like domain